MISLSVSQYYDDHIFNLDSLFKYFFVQFSYLFKGLEDPSVAVKCSPILYKLLPAADSETDEPMVNGNYRCVYLILSYLMPS